jgi:nitroreductase / dihydropteridine reductase
MNYLDALQWRYATKKFDPTKLVDPATVNRILTAGNLAASSLGLQLLKILVIENKELRQQLRTASYNQSQITDASHLFLICGEFDITPDRVEQQMQLFAKVREQDRSSLDGFYRSASSFISGFSSDLERKHWVSKQGYIVLGQMMMACAIEKVDACPMEGFQPDAYAEILNLKAMNLFPILGLPIGYRSVEDNFQRLKKVRQPMKDYVITIK